MWTTKKTKRQGREACLKNFQATAKGESHCNCSRSVGDERLGGKSMCKNFVEHTP